MVVKSQKVGVNTTFHQPIKAKNFFALYFIRIYSKAHTSIQAYTLPTEQSLTEHYTQGKNSGCLQYFHDEW